MAENLLRKILESGCGDVEMRDEIFQDGRPELAAPGGSTAPLPGDAPEVLPPTALWGKGYDAAALSRFAILAIVARLHPVNDWIVFHDCLATIIAAILALRSVSSGLPLYRPSALALA